MIIMLVFIGKYPLKYIGVIVGIGILSLTFFILIAKAFRALSTTVSTWESRIESYWSDDNEEDDYQIEKLKSPLLQVKFMD
jgi:cell division protein FtsW